MALEEARRLDLDLSIKSWMVPTSSFTFECLKPSPSTIKAFEMALEDGLSWLQEMPFPVLTYHKKENKYRIMDGMMRICAAQKAGMHEIPALIASGATFDALQAILEQGYYGEDFMEMLALADEPVRENLQKRDRNRLAGL